MKKTLTFFTLFMLLATAVFAQKYTISGVVTSAETGEKLIGANVMLVGTTNGAATNLNGEYSLKAEAGEYVIKCSFVGYTTQEIPIVLNNNMEVNFDLEDHQFTLSVTVLADRAKERETPVAFTNVNKKDMELMLASQDVPMVLNTTPSVYSTAQGGGAGDARINIRGFNQRNVAVMINGIPVNDMENGWVYWSNWDGVGDASRDIQVQRGLSAVNLAVASIGGTMNIITDPAKQSFGLKLKQEFGNDSFKKTSFFANTGLVNNKWAVSLGLVRKVGDGYANGTWTDAYAYYLGASYNINKNNRLELYAVGAPQRHGQRSYRQNIAAFDADYAKDLDSYDVKAFTKFKPAKGGIRYNQNWNPLTTKYNGKQYWNGSTHDRYDNGFINERENYYHKPQINFNWYSTLSKKLSFFTSLYFSGGQGGGSGTLGSMSWDKTFPSKKVDWDATIKRNVDNGDKGSKGILRNSVNEQKTFGAIVKTIFKASESVKLTAGLDIRKSEIDHYREIRDLLGGKYFIATTSGRYKNSSDFWTKDQLKRGLGDKISYYNTNKVSWLGGYAQAEYSKDLLSFYGTVGFSTQKYDYVDHYKKAKDAKGNKINKKLHFETDVMTGYQLKTGAKLRVSPTMDIWGNVGYMSKVPIFDNVIDDKNGILNDNPKNEKILALEAGLTFESSNKKFRGTLNGYYSSWKDRGLTILRTIQSGDVTEQVLFNIVGVKQLHLGIEFEAAYQPVDLFRIDLAGSIGNWKFTDDVMATYSNIDNNQNSQPKIYELSIKDLKIGDAPQTQIAIGLTAYPTKGLRARLNFRYYDRFYSEFDPDSRIVKEKNKVKVYDRAQSWKVPSYSIFDLHVNYRLPIKLKGVGFELFANVLNLFNKRYISDAVDNSRYNAYDKDHDADDAEVHFGLPRTFNVGISINY